MSALNHWIPKEQSILQGAVLRQIDSGLILQFPLCPVLFSASRNLFVAMATGSLVLVLVFSMILGGELLFHYNVHFKE